MKNFIENLFKKKEKESEVNKFTLPNIIDRRLEPINICRRCRNSFGKDYENITIEDVIINKEKIVKVICNKCQEIHYFRNWDK